MTRTAHADNPGETIILYRPVGPKELTLIRESGFRAFPPRLPEQPIFYPVLNEEYATKIARDWNSTNPQNGHAGFVTRFAVRAAFLARYRVETVGSRVHQEYWIPADDLAEFNANIVGPIEVIAEYRHGQLVSSSGSQIRTRSDPGLPRRSAASVPLPLDTGRRRHGNAPHKRWGPQPHVGARVPW